MIDNIEKLKKEVEEWEFKSVKLLQDLNYEKYDEIAEIAKIGIRSKELGILKESTDAFKKLIIPKK